MESPEPQAKPLNKPPVVRGARACTVCRAAKMKCVGAEDGQKQCQRCKRANVECIFEKHRRGRKPGSKLSEASKMLRRLEKGLNNAKLKSQPADTGLQSPYPVSDPRSSQESQYHGVVRSSDQYSSSNSHFGSNELPPLNLPTYHAGESYPAPAHVPRPMEMDDDDDDADRNEEGMFPAKLIRKENQRHSFFRTILNPERETPSSSSRGDSYPPPQPRASAASNSLNDPISAGILDEDQVKVLFDLIFLRLNPFVNMFDPALHSVAYVRSRCPFLFTTLVMAGCKFFQPELYKQCRKLANEFAVRAFAEGWKRVEVVQAFTCLTHWKEPDENRTWSYIGYACRMAVELGLNRYVAHPPAHETEYQMRERRNRERTYLVLFVHDRSLSMQTGRQWMLPEDDLVRHSMTWHEQGGNSIRPEDVIVAAFVQLRRIASETTDMFYSSKASPNIHHNDVNYEVVLRNCNGKLTHWMDTWQHEMRRAGGETFHFSMLSFFRLHVRLFLNSFGIQASMSPSSRASPSLQALSACCTSALDTLQIVSKDFASMSMLRYGQDSITVMTAYSAVFLLRLLRSSNTLAQLHEGTAHEIHSLISKTADAYHDASVLSPASSSAAYHARFLRSLVANDIFTARQNAKDRSELTPIDPRLQGPAVHHATTHNMTTSQVPASAPVYLQTMPQENGHSFQFPASPHLPAHPTSAHHEAGYSSELRGGAAVPTVNHQPQHMQHAYPAAPTSSVLPQAPVVVPHHASELDAHYWRNMFLELGFGGELASSVGNDGVNTDEGLRVVSYPENTPSHHAIQPQHQTPQPSHQGHLSHPSQSHPISYQMHNSAQGSYDR